MKTGVVGLKEPSITWAEEEKTLTLSGEPVLELSVSRPKFTGRGPLVQRAERYYTRLSQLWTKHWSRERYLDACMESVLCRENARRFTPWRGELSGEISLNDGEYLSIRMRTRVRREKTFCLRWGDVWRWSDGGVVTLGELYAPQRHWRSSLRRQLALAAEELEPEATPKQRRGLLRRCDLLRFALTEERIEFYCAPAPDAGDALTLSLPRPSGS